MDGTLRFPLQWSPTNFSIFRIRKTHPVDWKSSTQRTRACHSSVAIGLPSSSRSVQMCLKEFFGGFKRTHIGRLMDSTEEVIHPFAGGAQGSFDVLTEWKQPSNQLLPFNVVE
jgi:hypothetical protein